MNPVDRQTPPQQHPLAELSLAPPIIRRLSNGIPVHTFHNSQLELAHFIIQVRTGILHEDQKHIALFTYALLKESSPTYSATEMADLLDFYGAYITVSSGLYHTEISIAIPCRNIPKIFPVLFDCLAHPKYNNERLDIYASLKIKDLEYNSRKTDVRSTQLMLHAIFGDQRTAGQFSTRENLRAVTVEQMQTYHQKTFCAENITVFATGNLNAEAEACLHNLFSQIPHGQASAQIQNLPLPADTSRLITEMMPDSVQSSITLCMVKDGYNAPERRPFSFLSTITGGYFGSRLMQNLRERNGYTYGITAGSVYFGNQALFIINSDVNAEHTQAAIDACFEELKRLQEEPVGTEELESARNYLLGNMLRDVDNSVSYLKRYAFWYSFGLDETEFQQQIQAIRNTHADTLQQLAKKHFNYNNFTRIIVGNTTQLTPEF